MGNQFSHEYEYPAHGDVSMDKFIIGFAENFKVGYCQFQMVFNDGSRTSGKIDQDDEDWTEKKINSALWDKLDTVEIKYSKETGRMVGIMMTSGDGDVDLESEDFNNDDYSDSDAFPTKTISLNAGERLIGFRSRQKGDKEGDYAVQFVKGIPK